MPLVNRTKAFDRTLDKALSKYERSRQSVEKELKGTASSNGDAYPGFKENHIRKKRIGLPEYKIRPAHGLRLIFLVGENQCCTPICAYKKGKPPQESKVKQLIKSVLKEVVEELTPPEGEDDNS